MTPLERVLTTLGHGEADRVPFFLPVTMHGARELGLSIRDYFSDAASVVEGQLRMQRRYGHDFLLPFLYAGAEVEAFGGDVVFGDDGPPSSGAPPIRRPEQIDTLEPPDPLECPSLVRVLEITRALAERSAGEIPLVGAVIGPFSLPVMQMGFEAWLRLTYEDRDRFWRLMAINEEFCVRWANLQVAAGATAVAMYDPVSSPTITAPDVARETGLVVAKRVLSRLNSAGAIHLASGRGLPILDDLVGTGAAMISASAEEDLAELKARAAGKVALIGNLNGLEMRRWSAADAEQAVKAALAAAGPGGGFILSDNHGEIPWQVPESTLEAIADAVREWGRFPMTWAVDG